MELPNTQNHSNIQSSTRHLRLTLFTKGNTEVSWSIIRQLSIQPNLDLIVFSFEPDVEPRFSQPLAYIATKANILYRNKVLRESHPIIELPPKQIDKYKISDFQDESINSRLDIFKPDIIIINGTKKIPFDILSKAKLAINLHHGHVPFYRGVSSADWVTLERNFNYYYVTVHLATETLDTGDVLSAERLIPYFKEPYSLFKRRLGLFGASVLINVIDRWPNIGSIQQPNQLDSRFFRHSDKPSDLQRLTETIFRSRNIQRFSLIQRYGSNILVLPYLLARNYLFFRRTNNLFTIFLAKHTTKLVTSPLAFRIGTRILKNLTRNTLPNGFYILNYHDICTDRAAANLDSIKNCPSIYTSETNFRSHLRYLSDNFECMSLTKGLEVWRNGGAQHTRLLAITFDDGLSSPNEHLSDMCDVGLRPTYFICTDTVTGNRPLWIHETLLTNAFLQSNKGNQDIQLLIKRFTDMLATDFNGNDKFSEFVRNSYASQSSLHKLCQLGMIDSLGSHTKAHRAPSSQSYDDQWMSIHNCHQELKTIFNTNLKYFSYPFGKLDRMTIETEYIASRSSTSVFQCNGGINFNPDRPGSVLRIGISNLDIRKLDQLLKLQWTS